MDKQYIISGQHDNVNIQNHSLDFLSLRDIDFHFHFILLTKQQKQTWKHFESFQSVKK